MTSKTLTGTYSGGYTLAASYSSLLLTATALIEGAGLSAPAPATVTNRGSILAGVGASGAGAGGTGHTGVKFGATGRMTNSGIIVGGKGGNAGYYDGGTGASGYAGGTGGAGLQFLAAATAVNSGSIFGGAGGYGGAVVAYGWSGVGGGGGAGVELAAGGTLSNSGFVGGGGGGESVRPINTGFFGHYGPGGNGGGAVVFGASGSLANTGIIKGGYGGYGGFSNGDLAPGRGGDGVLVANAAVVLTVTNAGEILGGVGGSGAHPSIGGDGIRIAAGRVVNSGTIAGGNGAAYFGTGVGGDGILVGSGTVVNSGTIAGGDGQRYSAVGGVGLVLKSTGVATNTSGLIEGGKGGDGSNQFTYATGDQPAHGGQGGYGVDLDGAGTLANHATIAGGQGGTGSPGDRHHGGADGGYGGGGVWSLGRATILNLGLITGGAGGAGGAAYSGPNGSQQAGNTGRIGNGVNLSGGGTLTNGSAALTTSVIIGAYAGVVAHSGAAATVINFGTIEGADSSVLFQTPNNLLIAEAGAVFDGYVSGGGGAFDFNGGTGAISDLGVGGGVVTGDVSATFGDFGSYLIGAGGDWTLSSGALGSVDAQTLTVNGALNVTGALSVAAAAQVTLAGTLNLVADTASPGNGGELDLGGALGGTGTLSVGAGALADFETGASLAIGHVTLSTATSQAQVNDANLTYAGKWTQNAGTLSVAGGDTVTFTGVGDTFKGTLGGAGAVVLGGGTDTLSNLTINDALTITGPGTVTATGSITMGASGIRLDSGTLVIGLGTGGATFSGELLIMDASSVVIGASATSTLTNIDTGIWGAGQLGDGRMRLVNHLAGEIAATSDTAALVINTGTVAIVNDGELQSFGAGGLIIESGLSNNDLLEALQGNITAQKAVSGTGSVEINSATADFASTFTQNVDFVSAFDLPPASGTLELAKSRTYTGTISGFTTTGTTALDLVDIKFASGTTKATYSGTTSGGVLTVSDGTHTAHINFAGNYTTSGWTLSSDGHGGTTVVDPPKTAATPPHMAPLVAALAGFGASGGAGPTSYRDAGRFESALLTRPA
ncbi:MAG TPA: hypothetical protein VG166_07965 [Caulobacteraceae bacterium]|jgi:hypothetical protein|nr:hypothetical protein [Caulobacteraceae bacterium]